MNKTRIEFQFCVGDWVMISVHDTPREATKLEQNWKGPFQNIHILDSNSYRIRSPLGSTYIVNSSRMWYFHDKSSILSDGF